MLSPDTVITTLIEYVKIKYIIWQLRVKSQLLFQDCVELLYITCSLGSYSF